MATSILDMLARTGGDRVLPPIRADRGVGDTLAIRVRYGPREVDVIGTVVAVGHQWRRDPTAVNETWRQDYYHVTVDPGVRLKCWADEGGGVLPVRLYAADRRADAALAAWLAAVGLYAPTGPLPQCPARDTAHEHWLAVVATGEAPDAGIEAMDAARRALAARADRLTGGRHHPARATEAAALRTRHDGLLRRMLEAGWR